MPELFRLPKEPLHGSIIAVFAVLLCHDCHKVLVAQLARVLLNTYLCERTVQISIQIEEKPCDNLCLLGAKDRDKREERREAGDRPRFPLRFGSSNVIELGEIQEGLAKEEFFLEYLPTCSLKSNRCVGAEALIRWRRGSTVLPGEFIPRVENTPLSGLLTYWVIETVGRELGSWLRTHAGVHLHINVPPEILGRGGIAYAVAKAGLMDVAHKIVLEVTERGVPDKLN
jgi:hypothetical protein